METERSYFRLCSSCRKELPFESHYYVCSVSTCNRKRTGLSFCSMPCFEAHVPIVRHREAWAEEARAPSRVAWLAEQDDAEHDAAAAAAPDSERRVVGVGARASTEQGGPLQLSDAGIPRDVLIVVSKLKAYVRARSGMNTSDGVIDVLSDIVRELCDSAVRKAAAEGRKTLMDRDF